MALGVGLGITFDSERAFVPTDVANLLMWLDPSSAAHRTESGGKISGLIDRTGNGNNATSAGAGTDFPIGSIGALTCMAPAGGSRLILPNFSSVTDYAEIFAIIQPSSMSGNQGLWLLSTGAASYAPFSDGKVYESFGKSSYGASAVTSATLTTASPNVYNVSVVGSGGAWTLRINGTQDYTTNPAGNVAFHTFGWLGQNWSGVAYSGKIGEVLLYRSVLSSAERSQVFGYLRTKWGTV